jgi:DNA-binding SARP family transcriptional activator
MSTLYARLFGRFGVRFEDHEPAGFEASKVRELFAFLALHRDHALPREYLGEQLWSESSGAQSRKNLRQTLWQLQLALGSAGLHEPPILVTSSDSIQFNTDADVWLDVHAFEQASVVATRLETPRPHSEHIAALTQAVELYQGDLLEGWYQDWCLFERERLQVAYLAMLNELVSHFEQHQAYDIASSFAERILRCDAAHERAHRRLMRLYYLRGDRTAALRQYDRCRAALADELDAAPAHETDALREQIRLDRVDAVLGSGEAPSRGRAVVDAVGSLRRAVQVLADAQRVLEGELRALE